MNPTVVRFLWRHASYPTGWSKSQQQPTAPQQTASNDLIIEGLGRIGAKRILTNKPEELTEAQPAFRPNRHSKDWIFNEGHRRQPWHSNRTGMIWRPELPAPATALTNRNSVQSLDIASVWIFCTRLVAARHRTPRRRKRSSGVQHDWAVGFVPLALVIATDLWGD
jgi:hypothetical protein